MSHFTAPCHHDAAVKTIELAKSAPDALVVLTAGENQFSSLYLAAGPEILSRLVVILHQPPSWLKLFWRDFGALQGLRAVVCLCESQATWLKSMIDTPVVTIRHGVRHDVFRPSESSNASKTGQLLFVGQWLRDFATLEATLPRIWAERPGIIVNCVLPYSARSEPCLLRMALDDRVRWHANLSIELLCKLYQQSAALLLPLVDSTANNALGEALASGLPIVSTRVGGTSSYVPEDAGILCPRGDAAAHGAAVLELLSSPERQATAARIGRSFATSHLDWNSIAQSLLDELQ